VPYQTNLLDLNKNEELLQWFTWLNKTEEEEKLKSLAEDKLK